MKKHLPASILTVLLASALAACGGKSTQEIAPTAISTTDVDLAGEELIMGMPFMLRLNDYLVITDFKTDSVVTIIDLKNSANLGNHFSIGQGPEEFGKVTLLSQATDRPNSFFISDPNKHRLTRINLDDKVDEKITKGESIAPDSSFWEMRQIADGRFISTNGYVNYLDLFTVFDSDGTFAGRTGNRQIPDDKRAYKPVDLTAAFQYTLAVSPDGTHIAAIGMGEQAMFYELQGDSIALIGEIYNEKASPDHVFEPDGYRGINGESTKPWGFMSGAASNDGVYILKSSQPFCADSWVDNQLLFYDWNGNLKADYRLDRKVSQISSPGPDGTMYGIVVDDCDPTLVTINLPR